jgi:cytidyltransferase-like protein
MTNEHMTVLVFGTFDRWHAGHEAFLQEAASFGDHLIVSVARDDHVLALKGKRPWRTEQVRLTQLRQHPLVSEAVLGDEVLGSYDVIKRKLPQMVLLGFDQEALGQDLRTWKARHPEYSFEIRQASHRILLSKIDCAAVPELGGNP